MNRIKTLFFLEHFIYGGCAEAHGSKAALQWYDWMIRMMPEEYR